MDCGGLVIKVAHDLGLSDFDVSGYGMQATDESMLELCREHLVEVPQDAMAAGDIIVMRFGGNRHIGIVGDYKYGGLTVIHAQTAHPRAVVESRLDADWLRMVKASVAACFSFPGVSA